MAQKKYSTVEQAAIVLLSLGEDVAASLMAQMNHNEVRRVATALSRLGRVSDEDAAAALANFEAILRTQKQTLTGGAEAAKRLVQQALGSVPASIGSQLDLITPALKETLAHIDERVLADFLRLQLPQVAAVVLAHLESRKGGQVLKLLPPEQHLGVIRALATLGPVDAGALAELEEALQELSQRAVHQQHDIGGAAKVAALIVTLDKDGAERLLAGLEERQPELAAQVRALMFRFQDLVKLDDRSLQLLLRKVPAALLPTALRGADSSLAAAFYRNMSARAAAMLQDEITVGAALRKSDVEAAQKQVAETARAMLDAGELSLLE